MPQILNSTLTQFDTCTCVSIYIYNYIDCLISMYVYLHGNFVLEGFEWWPCVTVSIMVASSLIAGIELKSITVSDG